MRPNALLALILLILPLQAAGQGTGGQLGRIESALGASGVTSLSYTGTGSSAMLGQGLTAGVPAKWVLLNFRGDVQFSTPGLRFELERALLDGGVPFGGARQVWLLSGDTAWNVGANGTPAPLNPRPDTQMSSLEERQLQVWLSTPVGFLRGAQANRATTRPQGQALMVTFTTPGGVRVTGTVGRTNQVERVEALIDHPVLGDMLVETLFSNYKAFGALQFPARIVQRHGGFTTLELDIATVQANGVAPIEVPAEVRAFQPAPIRVDAQALGRGIWYMAGGSHHSILIEFADHLVLVDAPLGDARTNAVIAEARTLVPNKPIRYLIQSHHHFDHQGGTRAAAAEVDTVLTGATSREYWQAVISRPRTIRPDKLAARATKPAVEGVPLKRVLSDSARTVEIHAVPINGHTDEMLFVYIPGERILVEVDAYTPGPANAPPPARPNPQTVAVLDHIERLKLDVQTVAPLHGRTVGIDDLRRAARPAGSGTN
jgi:glyoxylase-like metal-dependent hydrolase (beta-lactamase superfamily II)